MPLDHTAYPHLLTLILTHSAPATLLAVRATSKTWRERIDALLARRVVVSRHGAEHPLGHPLSPESSQRAAFEHTHSVAITCYDAQRLPFPSPLGTLALFHPESMYDPPPYATRTLVACSRFTLPSQLGPGVLFAANVHVPPAEEGTSKLVLRVTCDDLPHPGAYAALYGLDIGPWVRRVVLWFEGNPGASVPEYARTRTLCMAASVAGVILASRGRFTLLDINTWDAVWMWPWPRDPVFDDEHPDLEALFHDTFVETAQREFAYGTEDIERAWSRVEFATREAYRDEIGEETWADEWWDLAPRQL